MHILLDNLTAALVAALLFVAMVTVNQRTQQMMTESTGYYAMVKQTDNFIQILRRDMQGIAVAKTDSAGVAVPFRFDGLIGDNSTLHTFEYVPEYVLTRQTEEGPVLFYQIHRYVDGVPVGGSPSIITAWEVVCLSAQGLPIDDPNECSQVKIVLEAAAPFGELSTVKQTNWSQTYHPPLLQ